MHFSVFYRIKEVTGFYDDSGPPKKLLTLKFRVYDPILATGSEIVNLMRLQAFFLKLSATQKTVLSIYFRTVSEYFVVLFQEDAAEQRGEGEGEPGLRRGDV